LPRARVGQANLAIAQRPSLLHLQYAVKRELAESSPSDPFGRLHPQKLQVRVVSMPISAAESLSSVSRALREREHLSQPVFARYLNVSKNLVSDWERGVKRPGGPALRLLTVIEKKGIQAIA